MKQNRILMVFGDSEVKENEVEKDVLKRILLSTSTSDIYSALKNNRTQLGRVSPANIPQFSKFSSMDDALSVIVQSGDSNLTYEKVGRYLCKPDTKENARRKYGENHSKLAVEMGLAHLNKFLLTPTYLGEVYFHERDDERKAIIRRKLILHIPIIQQALFKAEENFFSMSEYMLTFLSESTMKRRRPNIRRLIDELTIVSDDKTRSVINRIVW